MSRVQITLTNREAYITDCSAVVYEKLNDYWSFFFGPARFHPGYKLYVREKLKAIKKGKWPCQIAGWDGRIRLLKQGTLPAGVFRATRLAIKEELGIRFKVKYIRPDWQNLEGVDISGDDKKYIYQAECIDTMLASVRKGGGTILSATGTGKTRISGVFASKVPGKVLFLVDQIDLLYQSQKEIERWLGEPVGIVGNNNYQIERVTVATVQTLWRHTKDKEIKAWFKHIDIVIVDELHVQMGRKNFKVLDLIRPTAKFGLTASLQMKQAPVRFKVWAFSGPVIFTFPIAQGVASGVLTDGEVLQLRFPAEYDGLEVDYQEDLKVEVLENIQKLKACSTITRWLIANGKYVLILVSRVAHLKAIDELFANVPHKVAYGAVGRKKRKVALKKFEAGDVKLIIANVVFQKGVSVNRVDVIYAMDELPGKNAVIQKFGRGVRLHKDKLKLLYIDQGTVGGRFGKSARSRARALKQQGIPCKVVAVQNGKEALKAVKAIVKAQTTGSTRIKGAKK